MLTVLGEALIDLVAGEEPNYAAHCGGSPLNVAIGLARLGHPTQLMARLSTDAFGRRLHAHAVSNGVLLDAAPRVTEPSTLAIASLDDEGRAEYDFYVEGTADWQWSEDELAAMVPSTVFHTGSLAAWTPPGAQRISDLAASLRARGDVLVSYDPNVRPGLLRESALARPIIEASVANAHLVKCSEDDLAWLYPDQAVESVLTDWLERGATMAVVTRGGDGVLALTDSARVERAAMAIDLVDTIGAGDAFMAGLLAGLVARDLATPNALTGASQSQLSDVVDDATLVAGLTCERHGAQPPTADEFAAAAHRIGR